MAKKRLLAVLAAIVLITFTPSPPPAAAEEAAAKPTGKSLYVATNGSDTNNGSKNHPFKTLEKARDAIRKLKAKDGLPAGGVTVYLREGRYERSGSFDLNEQDSAKPGSRLSIRLIRERR